MAGRIAPEDIAAVRDRVRIDEVVSEHLTLRPAGGGSLKGLCPFHEERTPSFHVTPAKGLYYCFGCGKGGDAIDFIIEVDHLSFAEAVEKLAARIGLTLRLEGGGPASRSDAGERNRIVAINAAAHDYFRDQLTGSAAREAQRFLDERGFPQDVWGDFGVGYAPRSGLVAHLRRLGFTEQAIVASGVAGRGDGRTYDRFRDRVTWPIRDVSGDIVGFGARRLADDAGPKYLNTPDTPAFHKSQVLYGLYEARKAIARDQQAVIVEGYTDVMACHLAGVKTAVATCGTAFGSGHVRILRRLLLDDASGQVIYTFDGDAAGQRAAVRAYEEDQQFAAQTLVAIARDGLDPCDLRLRHGDDAVRALIASRIPLFEFVMRSAIEGLDLSTAEGRAAGIRAVAPVLAKIKDPTLRQEYARQATGWLGVDASQVRAEMQRASGTTPPARPGRDRTRSADTGLEGAALQAILHEPPLAADWLGSLDEDCFTHPSSRTLYRVIAGTPLVDPPSAWIRNVLDNCPDDAARALVRALVARPIPAEPVTPEYVSGILARLLDRATGRRAAGLRAGLGSPGISDERSTALLADLLALEDYRRSLREYWAREE